MATNDTGCCPVTVPCCGNLLPDTLNATISNLTNCSCADGASIKLVWDPMMSVWTGTGAMGSCGNNITLNFSCGGGGCTGFGFALVSARAWTLFSSSQNAGCGCRPLHGGFNLRMGG